MRVAHNRDAFLTAVAVVHDRNSLRMFREIGKPRSTIRADESSAAMSSGIDTSTLTRLTYQP